MVLVIGTRQARAGRPSHGSVSPDGTRRLRPFNNQPQIKLDGHRERYLAWTQSVPLFRLPIQGEFRQRSRETEEY